jgi:hypothetical protein
MLLHWIPTSEVNMKKEKINLINYKKWSNAKDVNSNLKLPYQKCTQSAKNLDEKYFDDAKFKAYVRF